jgi:flagellar basal-body rod protein FlgG
MDRGLYIAASGMLAELARQDQIANDLANGSTPGYKPDRAAQQSFGDVLLQNTKTGETVGPLGLGSRIRTMQTDLTPGPLKETGETLDVGIDGEGFLVVQTPEGTRYTRNGQLVVDAKGELATATGFTVLDDSGKPIQAGTSSGLTIATDGTVSRNGRRLAKLGLVSLGSPVKQGDTLFAGTAGARPTATTLKQGFLEGSGVNAARSMVDMLVSMRAYEAEQRVIHAIDETLAKGISAGGA